MLHMSEERNYTTNEISSAVFKNTCPADQRHQTIEHVISCRNFGKVRTWPDNEVLENSKICFLFETTAGERYVLRTILLFQTVFLEKSSG